MGIILFFTHDVNPNPYILYTKKRNFSPPFGISGTRKVRRMRGDAFFSWGRGFYVGARFLRGGFFEKKPPHPQKLSPKRNKRGANRNVCASFVYLGAILVLFRALTVESAGSSQAPPRPCLLTKVCFSTDSSLAAGEFHIAQAIFHNAIALFHRFGTCFKSISLTPKASTP